MEFYSVIKKNEIICKKMDGTGGNYATLNKAGSEQQIHVQHGLKFICMYACVYVGVAIVEGYHEEGRVYITGRGSDRRAGKGQGDYVGGGGQGKGLMVNERGQWGRR